MIAVAALDLRGGRAVQLVGGVPGSEPVALDDPIEVAAHWVGCGFRALHVIDLDAALGSGNNGALVRRIVRECEVPVQVGGGLRDDHAVREILDAGAARAITGTRAVDDAAWCSRIAGEYPGRIVLAADVRDGTVVTRGWTAASTLGIAELLRRVADIPLAGVLVTDVNREGRLAGADAPLFASLVAASRHPIHAAGGIRDVDDLRALDAAGVKAAVLGMALYMGTVDARSTATEFAR